MEIKARGEIEVRAGREIKGKEEAVVEKESQGGAEVEVGVVIGGLGGAGVETGDILEETEEIEAEAGIGEEEVAKDIAARKVILAGKVIKVTPTKYRRVRIQSMA